MAEAQRQPPRAAAQEGTTDTDRDSESTPNSRRSRLKRMIRKAVRAELRKANGSRQRARRNPDRRRRLLREMRRIARLLRRAR